MVKDVKHVYLADLHFDHKIWLNELDFYKDEIQIFSGRLSELEERNSSIEFTPLAEALQNRLILQSNVLSDLKHEIKAKEQKLAEYAEGHPIAINHVYFTDHTELRGKVTRFKELYNEFKSEFNRFAAKWM